SRGIALLGGGRPETLGRVWRKCPSHIAGQEESSTEKLLEPGFNDAVDGLWFVDADIDFADAAEQNAFFGHDVRADHLVNRSESSIHLAGIIPGALESFSRSHDRILPNDDVT